MRAGDSQREYKATGKRLGAPARGTFSYFQLCRESEIEAASDSCQGFREGHCQLREEGGVTGFGKLAQGTSPAWGPKVIRVLAVPVRGVVRRRRHTPTPAFPRRSCDEVKAPRA